MKQFGWKVVNNGLKKITHDDSTKEESYVTNNNRFKVLEDDLDLELDPDNTVVKGIACDIKNEELEQEYAEVKKKLQVMRESYDVEVMSGQVM